MNSWKSLKYVTHYEVHTKHRLFISLFFYDEYKFVFDV